MLKLINSDFIRKQPKEAFGPKAHEHHTQLVEGFLKSYRIRNYSQGTIDSANKFLNGWFTMCGTDFRPLYTWEAMEPVVGRKRIVAYGQALIDSEISNSSIRRYLGVLRSYFDYVIDHPYIYEGVEPLRLIDLYGKVEQPISKFDIPQHSHEGTGLGIPLEAERLPDFYKVVRNYYLTRKDFTHMKARNYTMLVLAGETGMRIDEILHLELDPDLFFKSKRIQTRHAKGKNGSGKRARTIFLTPLLADTLKFYIESHRARMPHAKNSRLLFFGRAGTLLSYPRVYVILKDMVKTAQKNGVFVADHFCWHWFRRLYATRFIEKHPDKLPLLINRLGHTSMRTVHSYIHHSEAWIDQQQKELLEMDEFSEHTLDV